MGLFSTKTKISVFAATLPLADDDENLINKVIVSSVLNGGSIADDVVQSALHGMAANVNSMLDYAENEYTLGLPSGANYVLSKFDDITVANTITEDLNLDYGCVIDYTFTTILNAQHTIIPFLESQRGFNFYNNTISVNPPGLTYPAVNLQHTNSAQGIIHKVTVTGVAISSDLTTATITYQPQTDYSVVYDGGESNPSTTSYYTEVGSFTETIAIPKGVEGFQIGQTYVIAKYFNLTTNGSIIGVANYWYYNLASGKYPALTAQYNSDAGNNLYPVVPLRYYNQSYTDDAHQSTDLYKTSKRLLDKVGIDIDSITEKLEENPDIASIDHAYIMFGINLQTDKNDSITYLTEFFDYLADKAEIDSLDYQDNLLSTSDIPNEVYSFLINPSGTTTQTHYSDSDSGSNTYTTTTVNSNVVSSLVEHGLNINISYKYIGSHLVKGSIGSIGTATMTKSGGYGTNYTNNYSVSSDSTLTLRLQITKNVYKEVQVKGLVHTNYVYGGYAVVTTLNDIIADPNNNNLVIPLHHQSALRMPLIKRNQMYMESLMIVVTGYEETKVRWYQRGIFKVIVLVILIIIAYFTGNWQLVALYIAGWVISAILPPKLAMVVNIIIIIYSMGTNIGAWGNTAVSGAELALNLALCVVQLASIAITYRMLVAGEEFEDIMSGLAAEAAVVGALLGELLDVSSFLDAGMLLNRSQFTTLLPHEYNDVGLFYDRTIHNTNPGAIVLDYPSLYHSIALKKPEFKPELNFDLS